MSILQRLDWKSEVVALERCQNLEPKFRHWLLQDQQNNFPKGIQRHAGMNTKTHACIRTSAFECQQRWAHNVKNNMLLMTNRFCQGAWQYNRKSNYMAHLIWYNYCRCRLHNLLEHDDTRNKTRKKTIYHFMSTEVPCVNLVYAFVW